MFTYHLHIFMYFEWEMWNKPALFDYREVRQWLTERRSYWRTWRMHNLSINKDTSSSNHTSCSWSRYIASMRVGWITVHFINCTHLWSNNNNTSVDYDKYAGPPYCRAKMYAGRVACCPMVCHGGHADGTDRRTDGESNAMTEIASSSSNNRKRRMMDEMKWLQRVSSRGQRVNYNSPREREL